MGTRICVKGLPRHADEATLRTHFANIGSGNNGGGRGSSSTSKVIITDAKVVRTPDGRSRQFGFVGLRSHEDALRALEYFDRSFMGAARLSVEWASGVGGGSERGDGGGDEGRADRGRGLRGDEAEDADDGAVLKVVVKGVVVVLFCELFRQSSFLSRFFSLSFLSLSLSSSTSLSLPPHL